MTAQLPLEFGHRVAMGSEDFLVADSNRDAVAWIERWPAWPAPALVLSGPPGSGRSHLLQLWRDRAGAVLVPGRALAAADPDRLAGREGGGVAVDDADDALDEGAERALLHLYNLLAASRRSLLLAARQPAARWPIALPDLASRLRAAPSVVLPDPDDALLEAVLVKLFADRQLRVDRAVVAFLMARIERSLGAARRVVDELDRAALSGRRPVTVHLARAVLDGAPAGPADDLPVTPSDDGTAAAGTGGA